MSLTVDSSSLFGSGPARLTVGPVVRRSNDAFYPGVVGQARLVLFGDTRKIVQEGLLTATAATVALAITALYELINVIEGHDIAATTPLALGTHTLIDDDGVTWEGLTLDTMELTGRVVYIPVGATVEARATYRAVWTQLQPTVPTPPAPPPA